MNIVSHKKWILTFLFLFSILSSAQAQQKTIYVPDPRFREFLRANYINRGSFEGCMKGDSLILGCEKILKITSLSPAGQQIKDLTGIEAFVNLQELFCHENELTFLPTLPSGLINLSCERNKLTSLPDLPKSLQRLECRGNSIKTFNLPNGLINFGCALNGLTSLPSLPNNLQRLDCNTNDLTSLLPLPNGLTTLICDVNLLTSLPPLPSGLQYLDCSRNSITSLPDLPNNLQELYCEVIRITTLPTLPPTLQRLDCSQNKLTTLPALPSKLQMLDCNQNQLASLPSLPNSLQRLLCSDNLLTMLPPLPNSLYELSCFINQLTSLPILPNNLQTLNCSYNRLTYLPTLPNSLYGLSISGNSITCLPNRPTHPQFRVNLPTCTPPLITSFSPTQSAVGNIIIIKGSSFYGTTNIKFNGVEVSQFRIDNDNQITVIIPQGATSGKISITNRTGTTVSNNNFVVINADYAIKGRLIQDENSNCQTDNTEKGMAGILVKAGEFYGSTDSNGNYSIGVPAGNYQISQILPKAKQNVLVSTCEKNYTATFAGLGETKSGFDFFNKVVDCSYLTVDIASDRRRRCFRN